MYIINLNHWNHLPHRLYKFYSPAGCFRIWSIIDWHSLMSWSNRSLASVAVPIELSSFVLVPLISEAVPSISCFDFSVWSSSFLIASIVFPLLDNVSGLVDVSNAVTIEMLDEHNNNENAHTNLIKRLFGSATATMESVKNSVQGWCKESIASIFGIASATQTNVKNKILEYAQEQINSWLETLGIRYNIAQNGYICLGKLFGDAIIQWGTNAWENLDYNIEIKLPTAYTNKNFINLGTVINSGVDHTKSATLTTTTGTKTTTPLNANELRLFWLSFGQ